MELNDYTISKIAETTTHNITYDNNGNPTAITNFKYDDHEYDYATLTWEGRRLVGIMLYDTTSLERTIEYRYNDQGVRVSIDDTDGDDYVYVVDGDLVLVELRNNTDFIYYSYDVDGKPISMTYDGDEYFYVYDLQGNVIGLMNDNGSLVVEYKYDAWGNIIDQTNSNLAVANRYRYRGYRYDEETGYYYLQSRYYNPEMARFINMDDVSFLSADDSTGINLFAYCANNPVMYTDPSGEFGLLFWIGVAVVTVVATAGAAKAFDTAKDLGYEGWSLAGYTASGLIAGDYFVVKDNWDAISLKIADGYDKEKGIINFDFTKNKYYSIYTASLYAKYLKNNYPVQGRTTLGMYFELQAHYTFDKVARPFGITNGNPAWLGSPDLKGDWTAWLFEMIARSIVSPTLYSISYH